MCAARIHMRSSCSLIWKRLRSLLRCVDQAMTSRFSRSPLYRVAGGGGSAGRAPAKRGSPNPRPACLLTKVCASMMPPGVGSQHLSFCAEPSTMLSTHSTLTALVLPPTSAAENCTISPQLAPSLRNFSLGPPPPQKPAGSLGSPSDFVHRAGARRTTTRPRPNNPF